MKKEKAVYKMTLNFGSSEVESTFVAEKQKVEKLIESGIAVYLGRIHGNHSEVWCSISEDDIEIISEDPALIKHYEEHSVGVNPLYCTTAELWKSVSKDTYEKIDRYAELHEEDMSDMLVDDILEFLVVNDLE